jgi:selenophosphate synthetase-related protein
MVFVRNDSAKAPRQYEFEGSAEIATGRSPGMFDGSHRRKPGAARPCRSAKDGPVSVTGLRSYLASVLSQADRTVNQSLADVPVGAGVDVMHWRIMRALPTYDKRAEFIDVTKSPGRMTKPL